MGADDLEETRQRAALQPGDGGIKSVERVDNGFAVTVTNNKHGHLQGVKSRRESGGRGLRLDCPA